MSEIYKALTEKNDEMPLMAQRAPVFGEGHRCGPQMTASGNVLCDCQGGSGRRHSRRLPIGIQKMYRKFPLEKGANNCPSSKQKEKK